MDTQESPLLSIIIVNYNVKDELLHCIQSIKDTIVSEKHPVSYEIIVSDNGSTDGSGEAVREKFPWVVEIQNGANLGFGKANNVGAKRAQGKILFFLNPDTILKRGISEMTNSIVDHPEVGLIGPLIFDQNGNETTYFPTPVHTNILLQILDLFFTPGVKLFYSSERHRFKRNIKRKNVFPVRYISGCAMMIPADLFHRLSGFDESIFMYEEEVDLCIKIRKQGYKIVLNRDTQLIHLVGRSTQKQTNEVYAQRITKALKIFLQNNFKRTWLIRYRIKMIREIRDMFFSYVNAIVLWILRKDYKIHLSKVSTHKAILRELKNG